MAMLNNQRVYLPMDALSKIQPANQLPDISRHLQQLFAQDVFAGILRQIHPGWTPDRRGKQRRADGTVSIFCG